MRNLRSSYDDMVSKISSSFPSDDICLRHKESGKLDDCPALSKEVSGESPELASESLAFPSLSISMVRSSTSVRPGLSGGAKGKDAPGIGE
jgi:hypothetical protein